MPKPPHPGWVSVYLGNECSKKDLNSVSFKIVIWFLAQVFSSWNHGCNHVRMRFGFVKHCKFGYFLPQLPLKFLQRHGYTPLPTPSNLYFASWKVETPFNSINMRTGFTGFKPPKKCTQMPDSAAGFQEKHTAGIESLRH